MLRKLLAGTVLVVALLGSGQFVGTASAAAGCVLAGEGVALCEDGMGDYWIWEF